MPVSDPRATRPSLLLRIRDAGDAASWEDFAAVYGPIIRGYCRRRGLQEADASDVGQEVLSQVARSIGGFEYLPTRGRFRDWLGTVTRNKITRFLENRGRDGPVLPIDETTARLEDSREDPEWTAEYHARILKVALERIRDDFEARTWDAFERIWGRDHPAPEVSRDLGMTIDAVYAAKSRVLRRLRDEVLALADDLPGLPPGA
jgi:RNA polymerase sigma factor (sigma-70 family)